MTLVELMVIITIIAVIAVIGLSLYQDIQRKTKMAADNGTAANMRSSVAIYYGKHNGTFPTDRATVNALSTPAPAWQCTTNVPAAYDPTNGKITVTLTLSDCP